MKLVTSSPGHPLLAGAFWLAGAAILWGCNDPKAKPPAPFSDSAQRSAAPFIDERGLQDKYTKLEFRPFNVADKIFTLWAPKGWEARPLQTSQKELDEERSYGLILAELGPVGSEDVVVQVSSRVEPPTMELAKVITKISDLESGEMIRLYKEAADNNRTVLSQTVERQGDRMVAEALLELNNQGLGRMTEWFHVFRRGDRTFVVKGLCPSKDYPRYEEAFRTAGRTLTFTADLHAP